MINEDKAMEKLLNSLDQVGKPPSKEKLWKMLNLSEEEIEQKKQDKLFTEKFEREYAERIAREDFVLDGLEGYEEGEDDPDAEHEMGPVTTYKDFVYKPENEINTDDDKE